MKKVIQYVGSVTTLTDSEEIDIYVSKIRTFNNYFNKRTHTVPMRTIFSGNNTASVRVKNSDVNFVPKSSQPTTLGFIYMDDDGNVYFQESQSLSQTLADQDWIKHFMQTLQFSGLRQVCYIRVENKMTSVEPFPDKVSPLCQQICDLFHDKPNSSSPEFSKIATIYENPALGILIEKHSRDGFTEVYDAVMALEKPMKNEESADLASSVVDIEASMVSVVNAIRKMPELLVDRPILAAMVAAVQATTQVIHRDAIAGKPVTRLYLPNFNPNKSNKILLEKGFPRHICYTLMHKNQALCISGMHDKSPCFDLSTISPDLKPRLFEGYLWIDSPGSGVCKPTESGRFFNSKYSLLYESEQGFSTYTAEPNDWVMFDTQNKKTTAIEINCQVKYHIVTLSPTSRDWLASPKPGDRTEAQPLPLVIAWLHDVNGLMPTTSVTCIQHYIE